MTEDEGRFLYQACSHGDIEEQETLLSVYPDLHLYGHDVLYHLLFVQERRVQESAGCGDAAEYPGIWRDGDRDLLPDLSVLHEFLPDPETAEGVRSLQYPGNGKAESGEDPSVGKSSDRSVLSGAGTRLRRAAVKSRGDGCDKDPGRDGGFWIFSGSECFP